MQNLDLPFPISSPFVWLAAAVVLTAVAVVVYRYGRPRPPSRPSQRDAPEILMPEADPGLPSRFARVLGYGNPAANPRGRVATILGLCLAVAAIALIFRNVEPAAPAGPVYVQTAVPRQGGSRIGGAESTEITGSQVAVDSATGHRLVLWSGDGQRGDAGRRLARLLSVVVTDSQQVPLPGVGVTFEVAPGGGSLETTSVETSEAGLAMTSWRLGQDPESFTVRAMLADNPDVSVRFTAELDTSTLTRQTDLDFAPSPSPPTASESDEASSGEEPEPAITSESAGAEPGNDNVVSPERAGRWAVGGVHSCRVNGAGGITCWGATTRPIGNRAMENLIWGVGAGVFHVCGITDEATIGCWAVGGADRQGLEGQWSLPDGARPEEVVVGSDHICARSSGGRVYCWGSNDRGQLGAETGDQEEPTLVPVVRDAVRLASGWFHSCALTGAGQAYCWGANGAGQLGLGSTNDSDRPAAVEAPAPFVDIVAGSVHTCALDSGGRVWCWGGNQDGQLGNPSVTSTRQPRRVDTDLRFASLAAGGAHTCGVTSAGTAWCWGRNVFGQLGDGSTDDARIPVPVSGNLRFARLRAGGAHTCGEAENGRLYCWGNNIQGQLGDGTRDNRSVPVRATDGDDQ